MVDEVKWTTAWTLNDMTTRRKQQARLGHGIDPQYIYAHGALEPALRAEDDPQRRRQLRKERWQSREVIKRKGISHT